METHRRMARTRAKLLAAVVAAGSAVRVSAQPPDTTVNVEPPRVQTSMPPSPLSVLPDPVQSAAFHLSGTSGAVQKMPAGEPAQTTGPVLGMPTPSETPPKLMATPATAPLPPGWGPGLVHPIIGPAAPAWRWYGYGGVNPTHVIPPGVPAPAATAPLPAATAPATITPPAGPTAPPSLPATGGPNLGTDSRPVGDPPVPAPVLPGPAGPLPPQPITVTDPNWKSSAESGTVSLERPVGTPPSLPATTGVILTASVTGPNWPGTGIALGPPRVAGSSTPRPMMVDPAVQPASYTSPGDSQAIAVRAAIERVCFGRCRDLEIIPKDSSRLLVRMKVRQTADAEYLANAIARLPELAPYQVFFEIQVPR